MEELKLEHIQIRPDSIQSVLGALDQAIEKHTEMKAILERLLALQGGGGVVTRRRRGRPPKSATAARTSGGPRRRRRTGGGPTLREVIINVLTREGRPVAPKDLTAMVRAEGYKTKAKPESFYTAVFNAARKEPTVENIGGAFVLNEDGAASGGATKRRKVKRSGGRRSKKKGRRKATSTGA